MTGINIILLLFVLIWVSTIMVVVLNIWPSHDFNLLKPTISLPNKFSSQAVSIAFNQGLINTPFLDLAPILPASILGGGPSGAVLTSEISLPPTDKNQVFTFNGSGFVWSPLPAEPGFPSLSSGQIIVGSASRRAVSRTVVGVVSLQPVGLVRINQAAVTSEAIAPRSVLQEHFGPTFAPDRAVMSSDGNSRVVWSAGVEGRMFLSRNAGISRGPSTTSVDETIAGHVLTTRLESDFDECLVTAFGSAEDAGATTAIGCVFRSGVVTHVDHMFAAPGGGYGWRLLVHIIRLTPVTGYMFIDGSFDDRRSLVMFDLSCDFNDSCTLAIRTRSDDRTLCVECAYSDAVVIKPR